VRPFPFHSAIAIARVRHGIRMPLWRDGFPLTAAAKEPQRRSAILGAGKRQLLALYNCFPRTPPCALIPDAMSILLHTPERGDGLGRRVKEHNVAGATVTDRQFVWDGMEMVQWQNADGTVQRNLFAGGEQIMAGAGVETLLYVTDHLGSVRGWHRLADGARGEAQFSAYGKRTITSNATGVPVKSFTGHYQHEPSGILLAPYRVYDPELGRWLSRDPIEEEGGTNLYCYVRNAVAHSNDPLGLFDPRFLDDLQRRFGESDRGSHSAGFDRKTGWFAKSPMDQLEYNVGFFMHMERETPGKDYTEMINQNLRERNQWRQCVELEVSRRYSEWEKGERSRLERALRIVTRRGKVSPGGIAGFAVGEKSLSDAMYKIRKGVGAEFLRKWEKGGKPCP
jgi:RHS repeat-associated protein